jgi:hypothetical protein
MKIGPAGLVSSLQCQNFWDSVLLRSELKKGVIPDDSTGQDKNNTEYNTPSFMMSENVYSRASGASIILLRHLL